MNYISVNLYRKLLNCALADGLKGELLHELSISIQKLDSMQVVPADHFFELHEKLDKELGPGFSVRAGSQMKMEDYGVLGLSWKTCSWAGEIFERSERYFHLLSNTYYFKVENKGEKSYVYLNRDAYRRGLELSNESTFAATVVVLQATTESDISPTEVSFKHAAPSSLKDYEEVFNCPVLFNQSHNYIAYNAEDLKRRTAKADESINKFLLERVQEETEGIELSPVKIARDIEGLIKDALPSGIPGIEHIGQLIGMSRRTLTRRLSENNITFRDLIKKSQLEVAKDLLKNSALGIADIAYETGFSEQSAFSRAFKNWTNQSPLEYRNS